MQCVDLVHHRRGVEPRVSVSRIGRVHRELERHRFAHREITFLAVFARNEAAPLFIGLGVVLDDEAAGAAHHVEANQLAPVVKFLTLLNRQNGVDPALVLALKLGFADTSLAHVVFGANADVGFFVDKQAQL